MRMRMRNANTLCGSALAENALPSYWRDVPNDLSSRITAIRRKLGLKQHEFAAVLGVTQTTVSRWEKGSVPNGTMLAQIAQAGGVDLSSLVAADFEAGKNGPALYIKGEVEAGVWRESWEWDQDEWQTYQGGSHIEAPLGARFGLRVTGESMNEIYPNGTILDCVHCINSGDDQFTSGQRVIVIRRRWHGEVEATVKEYRETSDGRWLVPRSNNPAFQQPISLDGSADPDIEEIAIVAVVRGSYRPE